MANQDVRVSALQSARTLSTDDLALATVVDELSETGYTSKKITEGAKASQYLEAFTFANLNTSAKTIVGAINEIATNGGGGAVFLHTQLGTTTIDEDADDIYDAYTNEKLLCLSVLANGQYLLFACTKQTDYTIGDGVTLEFEGEVEGYKWLYEIHVDATNDTVTLERTTTELPTIEDIQELHDEIVSMLPTESASGAVASFETPLTLPLVSHNVTIEPVQAGTGDPSPSNPRAISGWSAVTISHSGADTSEVVEIEITLGQTVYGGTLDVTSGVLTITKSILDLGSLTWNRQAAQNRFFAYPITGSLFPANGNVKANIICENYETEAFFTISSDTGLNNVVGALFTNNSNYITIRDTNYSTSADFKEAMDGVQLVYELATPVEVTLTPEQINTLKGVNNIWADTGDTAVEYKQDIQTYIDSRLSSGTRSLSLAKAPVETKEETKQEEQEGDENVNR